MTSFLRPTIAEIDLDAILANIRQIRSLVGGKVKVLPLVKSNAYGHGAVPVARAIESYVDALGVAYVYEGIELRRGGIKSPILVMGGILDNCLRPALEHNLILTLGDRNTAAQIAQIARQEGLIAKVHIEVDTGMGRLGLAWREAAEEILRIMEYQGLEIEGVFSHLATSEIEDQSYTLVQLDRFQYIIEALEKKNINIPIKHLANSAAILQYPSTWFDMVRPGLMVYGICPAEHLKHRIILRFPLTIKTWILQIRTFEKGESISYGRSFICPEHRKIATIPVGYADGLSRVLSNKAEVLINNAFAPIVGSICMDMCMIDVTHIQGVNIGDEVILIGGKQGDQMVKRLAELMGTISYEILTSFGRRVRRVYHSEEAGNQKSVNKGFEPEGEISYSTGQWFS